LLDGYVPVIQWKDNKVYCIDSTQDNLEPTEMVKRYKENEKKDENQYFRFYYYNQRMGGVNLIRRFASQHRPTSKVLYWLILFFSIHKNCCLEMACYG